MLDFLYQCNTAACTFDKTPTQGTIIYQIFIIVATIVILYILSKFKKNILLHYLVMVIGTFIFEFFTAPMWINLHLGSWSYVYHGVSWVLTLGLATMTLSAVVLVEKLWSKIREYNKFALTILILWPVMTLIERLVGFLGIRGYSPETEAAFNSVIVPGINMSILSIFYLPVMFMLIVAFYKYISFVIDNKALVPMNKNKILRNIVISIVGVLLFELLINPMVANINFPSWSYIYRDVTFLLTGGWVIVIWLSIWFTDKFFIHKSVLERFVMYLAYATIIITPIEYWLMNTGHRVYQPSTVANFSGIVVPGLGVPVEVIFAVPFYLALAIGFIKYWAALLDNKM
jgi:hypothetical protein